MTDQAPRTFLGYWDEHGNEMHCAHPKCISPEMCLKGCKCPVARVTVAQVREALANRLGEIAGRVPLERDRETIIEARNALRALTAERPEAGMVTEEMLQKACEVYSEVYADDDKDMGDAMRAALKAAQRDIGR